MKPNIAINLDAAQNAAQRRSALRWADKLLIVLPRHGECPHSVRLRVIGCRSSGLIEPTRRDHARMPVYATELAGRRRRENLRLSKATAPRSFPRQSP